MTKRLLCTVSEDPNMFNGLRFLCRFFKNKADFRLTLLCMASPNSTYCRWRAGEVKIDEGTSPLDLDANWGRAQEEAMRILKWDGFREDYIVSKCSINMVCRIEDIVDEIESAEYDAVVMGRRGLNRLQDFVDKSLSRKLMDKQNDIPMWLCRKPDLNRRNVLLCVDGSESSFNMAAHVARMVPSDEHMITLCHISKIKSDKRDESDAMFERCRQIFAEHGRDEERLRYMVYPSDHVPQAIMDNANWGKYAVVACGTTENPRKRLLTGSVTRFLFTELSGSVLWVHP